MTTLEALNWLAMCQNFRLSSGGPWSYKLEVWEGGGDRYEIERTGPLGEALPALVLGISQLMKVKP